MPGHRGQTRKRQQAIACLLSAPTIALAAQNCGISDSTLARWLREEGFLREYRLAQREALSQAIATLQAAAGSAVTVLRAAMLDQTATSASRVAAARVILEFCFRGAEIADFQERLEAIEAQLGEAAGSERAHLRDPAWLAPRSWPPPSFPAVPTCRTWSSFPSTSTGWVACARSLALTRAVSLVAGRRRLTSPSPATRPTLTPTTNATAGSRSAPSCCGRTREAIFAEQTMRRDWQRRLQRLEQAAAALPGKGPTLVVLHAGRGGICLPRAPRAALRLGRPGHLAELG